MPAPSRLFEEETGRKSVYNIQAISNIPSIISHGILSYNRAEPIEHESIAMTDVQNLRDNVIIPQGGPLHSYASAYFDPRNPMMYKLKNMVESLCVLAISATVLDCEDTIISDGNAASPISRFYSPEEGIQKLDFQRIYARSWQSKDFYEYSRRKRIKCAEILVPNVIAYEYIIGAIVVDEYAQQQLLQQGFRKQIAVRPTIFFGEEG